MKRKIALILALVTAGLMLASCGTAKTPEAPAAAVTAAEAATATASPTASPTKTPKATAPPTAKPTATPAPEEDPEGPITEPQAIADYLFKYGVLPDNFMTKAEARALGWPGGDLTPYAPGMSIGGDRFGNREGSLPQIPGVRYYEADCNYHGGQRGAERIIFSSEGQVWYTGDHYETFTELYPSK